MARPFGGLRSVRWRVDLGILPAAPDASVEKLRRSAADSRRRYASLRRRVLADCDTSKDEIQPLDLAVDNPLSQNPESSWGRLFRNAELEKTIDQDLSRLYPEDGSYFQTSACQALLRRILLLWCLEHPEYGYRQGMHELLAPLVYVLRVDLDHLTCVRQIHEHCFSDNYDELLFPQNDMLFDYNSRKNRRQSASLQISNLADVDPETKELFLLSDAYGTEGELGVVLSERFMEHDAYCLFDGLMVSMAEFFSSTDPLSSAVAPVIEASSALYHILSIVDPSLHSHLVEIGVEPQYFALRWLRVLFGREFSLDKLLIVWDEVFAYSNAMLISGDEDFSFKLLCSERGAFIASFAVSMLCHLRSPLLAAEIATVCLQRLLNFPDSVDVQKLIGDAKSLHSLSIEANTVHAMQVPNRVSGASRVSSPLTTRQSLPDNYWEEKWRILNGRESSQDRGDSPGEATVLLRSSSDPSPTDQPVGKNDMRPAVRRCLLEAFPGGSEELGHTVSLGTAEISGENSPAFSAETAGDGRELDNDEASVKSSFDSNSCADYNDVEQPPPEVSCSCSYGETVERSPGVGTSTGQPELGRPAAKNEDPNKRKPLRSKFQWLWKLGGPSQPQLSESFPSPVGTKSDAGETKVITGLKNLGQTMLENIQVIESLFQQQDGSAGVQQALPAMENLQNSIVGVGTKGRQASAMAALAELRKISNLLREM